MNCQFRVQQGAVARRIFAFAAGASLALAAASAGAALTHSYSLDGTLADTLGGPALVADGGTLNATDYSFLANQGLQYTGGLGSTYSVEMVFSLTTNDSAWRKLLDFSDRVNDEGFYYDPANHLNYFPLSPSGTTTIANGSVVHVVFTHDATNQISAYLNGIQEFSVTGGSAVLGAFPLHLFEDDAATGFGEAGAGAVDCVAIYDAALSAADVQALGGSCPGAAPLPVPEPSDLPLVALAMLGVAAARRLSK